MYSDLDAVTSLNVISRGEWGLSGPPHILPTLKESKAKSKGNPENREIPGNRKFRKNMQYYIYFEKYIKILLDLKKVYATLSEDQGRQSPPPLEIVPRAPNFH
jgi:hypothetical protein